MATQNPQVDEALEAVSEAVALRQVYLHARAVAEVAAAERDTARVNFENAAARARVITAEVVEHEQVAA